MWVLFLIVTGNGNISSNYQPAVTSHEFISRESCLQAAKFAVTKTQVSSAFCVKK